ncbi:T9SS type A sorting domain-containing protein [Flavobacterium sp. MFBS3-15]|uniref:T9SS type A sorting domain-containing protein n=1 Tax=Flavobacterium sp. MFBS3-15 TaxID=2989816 RepID=UPI0022360454|nr:T9SS type A sorting domain-containing protein [Flavobacterium sp. MFBS3-15]MCW4467925.1 T9SS type A sorting domain-containing protein [Flavobacterium sp. MFBS3-15]
MKRIITIITILNFSIAFSQIGFEPENILFSRDYAPSDITDVISADLNNDGFKEMIISSNYANNIIWYKNVNGDLYHSKPLLISEDLNIPKSLHATDLNNDGLVDIIAASQFDDKIVWYQNLGNDNFSTEIIVGASVDSPQSLATTDVNNDGFQDIIAGIYNDQQVVLYINNGDGTFQDKDVISEFNYNVKKVMLKDLDNDNLPEIITLLNYSNNIYWNKNNGNGNFSQPIQINAYVYNEKIDFADINNDSYPDLIYNSGEAKLSAILNQGGETFDGDIIIDNIPSNPSMIIVKDTDGDGLIDIVTKNSFGIGINKNNGNGFDPLTSITNEFTGAKTLLTEDLDNDGILEIFVSSFTNNQSNKCKISYFTYSQPENNYQENILDIYLGATSAIRIFDIDNDGFNDILSGYRTLVWNKNMGNGNFSANKILTNIFNDIYAQKIEIADLDNDGFTDIIAFSTTKIDLYRNMGDASFSLVNTLNFTSYPVDVEISDINNDAKQDILVTFTSPQLGVGKIINSGNFNFEQITYITTSIYGFRPSAIAAGDIDNDGDIDIVSVSDDTSRIHLCINLGNGLFTVSYIATMSTEVIKLADLNNDSYLDIITSSTYQYSPYGVHRIMNTNGTFSTSPSVIGIESLDTFSVSDINGDGYNDIVGVSIRSYGGEFDEELIAFIYNGSTYTKVEIDNLGETPSLSRDIDITDLNNDGKPDIATSYYFIGRTSIYLNSSTLGSEAITVDDIPGTLFYPNPTSGKIYWSKEYDKYGITIYDRLGQQVFSGVTSEEYFDIGFLSKGIYFLQLKKGNEIITKKVVKE